jgi:thiosulfate/3-mercaptopyruvate sulfurtransferase
VLRELLGHKNVKNYDGSWTEYGSLVGAPIELGRVVSGHEAEGVR